MIEKTDSQNIIPPGAGIQTTSSRQGFSLIEMIIVVLVASIITAVSAPRFTKSLQRHRLESAAKRIAVDIQAAQRAARNSGKNITITFHRELNQYTISGVDPLNHQNSEYRVKLQDAPYFCQIHSETFPAGVVQFDRFQRPTTSGTLRIQSGSLKKAIVLAQATGYVTIEEITER